MLTHAFAGTCVSGFHPLEASAVVMARTRVEAFGSWLHRGSINTLEHLFALFQFASLPAVLGPTDEKQNNGKVKRRVSLIVPSVSICNRATTAVTVLKRCLHTHTHTPFTLQ